MLRFDPQRHDAVIFDCDGTLVDTMPLHHRAWRIAFEKFGAPFDFSWELLNQRAGMSLERTVEELNRQFGCQLPPEAVAQSQREAYRQLAVEIEPIEFVVDFARRVSQHHPIAVASGSHHAVVVDALERIGLADVCRVVVGSDEVTHGKPSPDIFLLAATRLQVLPHRCLVIEDGESGLEAARHAGMDAYRVDRAGSAQLQANVRRDPE